MKTSRIHSIDGLRGLSLFGILMANMLIFQYGLWGKDELQFYSLNKIDHLTYDMVKIFIEGSFMPIFTFLFGYSMVIMQKSLIKKDIKVKRTFFRRFLFLAFLGFLHAEFLWEGDILFLYGIMGILLLMFINRKPKTILIWSLTLLCLTSLIGYGGDSFETDADKRKTEEYVQKTIDVYGEGSYLEIRHHRINEMPINIPDYLLLFVILLIPLMSSSLFLLGMYCAKKEWFTSPQSERKKHLLIACLLIPTGIMLKSVLFLFPDHNWSAVSSMFGANLLSLGYICLFALMYSGEKRILVVRMFESVGKLSLSNYLFQTIICTTIFYGYGVGLFGKLGVFYGVLLSLAIFSIQMIGSYTYLQFFKMGPFERVLRMFTNFTWKGMQKIKKSDNGFHV